MKKLLPLLLGATAVFSHSGFAQNATTTPVGAVTVTIAAGTGTNKVLTPVSFPLLQASSAAGQVIGQITGVTSNTITNSNAGWTPGSLSTVGTPSLIAITSGLGAGRIFLISSSVQNTASAVTIDASDVGAESDLSSLGVAVGDAYKILDGDTILSAFGTPETTGVAGGASSNTADIVQMQVNGAWRQYYYRTTAPAGWYRAGAETASNTVPIRPDTLIWYQRIANQPLNLSITGEVPTSARKYVVKNSGATPRSTFWPVDLTLATSGISTIPGWASGTSLDFSASTADTVMIQVSGAWRSYYFDGTDWRRVGAGTVSNTLAIKTGTGVVLNKKGVLTGNTQASQQVPYSL
jgi:hypothetical protein